MKPPRATTLLLLLLWACACGPMHTVAGDADVPDARPDAPSDGDGDVEADADERPDADPSDGDEAEVDADEDFDPSDTTWLLRSVEGFYGSGVRAIEPFPGGGFVVAGNYVGRPWIARFDSSGDIRWSKHIDGGRPLANMSVAPDARTYTTAGLGMVCLDWDGRVMWRRGVEPHEPLIRGLVDGTVILFDGFDVARYSPAEGILWSWHLAFPESRGTGEAIVVTEEGTIFLVVNTAVVAMDLDGELLWAEWWTRGAPSPVDAAAATEDGGLVVLGGRPSKVVRLDRLGRVEWLASAGRFDPGSWDEPCEPRCDVDIGTSVAVSPADEVMIAGYSTSANEVIGREPYTSVFALWLDPHGLLAGAVAMAERRPSGHSDGLAAAALPEGGWLVGGHWSDQWAVIASLDSDRTVGASCEHIAEVSLERNDTDWSLEPVEVTLEPSTFEVTDTEPLTIEDLDAPMERLCW